MPIRRHTLINIVMILFLGLVLTAEGLAKGPPVFEPTAIIHSPEEGQILGDSI